MASIEGVCSLIVSGGDDLKALENQLRDQEDAIRAYLRGNNCQAMATAMAQLRCAQHGLGLTFLLHAQSHVLADTDGRVFFDQVKAFLSEECDPAQIQMVPKLFVALCKKFLALAISLGCTMATIRPLFNAAAALAPSPSCLTPVHADALQACILSSCYHMGQRFLDQRPVFQVSPAATALTSADYLRYFYYAGMVFIGLKRYGDAIDMFQIAVTTSATALSAVVVEAYKKLLLCSLVLKGTKPTLPKYTSSAVSRNLKPCAAAYNELADKFATLDAPALAASLEAAGATLARDRNAGLARQAQAALLRWKIEQLTGTYLTLDLGAIVARTGARDAAEVERVLLQLVESGEMGATLDQRLSMVHFAGDGVGGAGSGDDAFDLARTSGEFQSAMGQLMAMAERVASLDASVSANAQYLSKTTSDCPSPLGAAPLLSSWDGGASAPMLAEYE